MSLSPEEINAAESMHRFVREYDQTRKPMLACIILVVAVGFMLVRALFGAHHSDDSLIFVVYLGCLVAACVMRRQQSIRYRESVLLLKVLEREHGDELPWMKDEAVLAAADKLAQELAKHPAAS